MGNGRFNVAVSFDERCGYVGTHPELRSPVTALSLGGLRRRIEIARLPKVESTSGWSLTVARGSSATAGGCRGGRGGLMLDPGVCAGLRAG